MIRAKFRVTSKTVAENGTSVILAPVSSGSKENEKFFRYTPWGKFEIGMINEVVASQFSVGTEYYVDFTATGKELL